MGRAAEGWKSSDETDALEQKRVDFGHFFVIAIARGDSTPMCSDYDWTGSAVRCNPTALWNEPDLKIYTSP